MRTTLTLEDDLAKELKALARARDQSFKEVVNDALRRGLATGVRPLPNLPPFVVKARACGFQPGIDIGRLNQLVDELEEGRFAAAAPVHRGGVDRP